MAPGGMSISSPPTTRATSGSGGALLLVAAAQVLIGLSILGIYEGYKAYYFNVYLHDAVLAEGGEVAASDASFQRTFGYADPLDWRSPMGASYFLAIFSNIFAVFGLAGILNAQRGLIVAFFAYNVAQMVISFHYFVDLCTDTSIRYEGEPTKLTSYEQATTAFIFINFLLSISATVFAVRSMDEIKAKQREEYNRFSVLSDTLQFEPDHA